MFGSGSRERVLGESMSRSKSSQRWLREHFNDQFVKASQKDGFRSRASYKLLELNKKDRIFSKGMTVVDLGAAPGGWSQVAVDDRELRKSLVAELCQQCGATRIQEIGKVAVVFKEAAKPDPRKSNIR